MDFLDPRDPAVQEFLWVHLVPTDIRHDYTLADALGYVYQRACAGEEWLVGDMDAGLVFRCVPAGHVLMPHIMGNPSRLRSLLPEALAIAWARGIRKVEVWTQLDSIVGILSRMEWSQEAILRGRHFNGKSYHDTYVMSLEAPT